MSLDYTKDLLREHIHLYGYEVGDYTYGLPAVLSWGEGARLILGRYCSIADGVTIFLGGNHRPDWVTTYPFPAVQDTWPSAAHITGHPKSEGDVRIGSDVWLGWRSSVMSGVTIGHGAVVAAQAVVVKDVPPYAIVGGNPATLLRLRFDEATIAQLLGIQWWNWPAHKVRRMLPQLCSGDIAGFIEKALSAPAGRASSRAPAA